MASNLLHGHLFRLAFILGAGFAIIAALTETAALVLVLNGLTLSIAAGVAMAYTPVALEALAAAAATRGAVLGLGVWLSWVATFMIRVSSILARDLGWPGVLNTDYSSIAIFLGLMAGICHLWAPLAGEGAVPTKSWLKIGALVALGVFIAFCVAVARHGAPAPTFHF